MLMPKRTKYRRPHKVRYDGVARKGTQVDFGEYGLRAQNGNWVTNRQIEAARIAITRHMKRGGKVWIKIFPHHILTKKPAEVRMGSGKGVPDGFVAVVKKNRIMFEVSGVPEEVARGALRLASHKLPMKTKIVKKGEE